MMLPLLFTGPALVVWLILPLPMRGTYRRAGLPPTASATAALALIFAAAAVLSGDALVARAVEERRAAFAAADVAPYRAQATHLVTLAFSALGVSGLAMIARGLAAAPVAGGISALRVMAGLGAYAFHAGTGLAALNTLTPHMNPPIVHAAAPGAALWRDQIALVAPLAMIAGLILVLVAVTVAILRNAQRG